MDNPQEIAGYRHMSDDELELINKAKAVEGTVGHLLSQIENQMAEHGDKEAGRWLSLARTHLETGFMYATKAIARPSNGLGRKNPK